MNEIYKGEIVVVLNLSSITVVACKILVQNSLNAVEHFFKGFFTRKFIQSRTKFMKQSQEIKRNWTGQKNFEIWFCIIFDHLYQNFICERETGY